MSAPLRIVDPFQLLRSLAAGPLPAPLADCKEAEAAQILKLGGLIEIEDAVFGLTPMVVRQVTPLGRQSLGKGRI
ncbi:MAG: hypothetical protein EOO22_10535 [Comamonadaceae bacterium]|nr:MAG: hypothetical protein EOO22_10535 [Comamonadaceae bacterium]